ncbi:MAG: hypothetical protein AAF191_07200, partial [Verrucomicrobiota bacterium]
KILVISMTTVLIAQRSADRGRGHEAAGDETSPARRLFGPRHTENLADLPLGEKTEGGGAPGELIEMKDARPRPDQTRSQGSSGGTTAATGQGGDLVESASFLPEEQAVLQRYFHEQP